MCDWLLNPFLFLLDPPYIAWLCRDMGHWEGTGETRKKIWKGEICRRENGEQKLQLRTILLLTLFLGTNILSTFSQDPVTPLAPSAPYTPISSVHPGVASLHSSPLHPSRSLYGGSPGSKRGYASPGRRYDVNLRAELEKHKNNLTLEDWQACSDWKQNNGLHTCFLVVLMFKQI